jgi:hypothetical protein
MSLRKKIQIEGMNRPLTHSLFIFLNQRIPENDPVDSNTLALIEKDLSEIPDCFKKSVLTIVGWYYHLEFRDSPWQDEKHIYYADGSYIKKKYLVRSSSGEYNVKREVLRDLFREWNNKLKG